MYDSILLPTDGSDASRLAVEHGVDIATRYGATVHLLYVVDESVYDHYATTDLVDGVADALERAGEEVLVDAADRMADLSVTVETAVRHGLPHEAILAYADEVGADLVVMGTEEQSADYRRLLGSVTERVVRQSSRPVHVVKAGPDDEQEAERPVAEGV